MADNILLAIFYNGAAASPDELPGEEQTPAYYATPKAAKAAGVALLDRHSTARGYWVRRIITGTGKYRTVDMVTRPEAR
jgi:hypothetical protein